MPRIPAEDKVPARPAAAYVTRGDGNSMLGEAFPHPLGGHMAVRDALLALLSAGPAYGFQLHRGLAARTGGRRAINVGQT